MHAYLLRPERSQIEELVDFFLGINPSPDAVVLSSQNSPPLIEGTKVIAKVPLKTEIPEERILENYASLYNGKLRRYIQKQSTDTYRLVLLPYNQNNLSEFIEYFRRIQHPENR